MTTSSSTLLKRIGTNGVNEKLYNMTVHVRTISGKTTSIRCSRRQSINIFKDEIEISRINGIRCVKGTTNGATLEMTLRLQGGMKEDETVTSAGSSEDRNLRRKHSEIGAAQPSDDTEFIKREISNASRRSEEK